MTAVQPTRLEELLDCLKTTAGRRLPEVVCDFEEAIRLATYSGRNDVSVYLISAYLEFFDNPVPYEVRFYCEYYTGTRLWRMGNLDEASAKYSSCRDLASGNGDGISASRCVMALGVIRWSKGDYGKALSLLERAEEGLRERRDLTLSNCLNWLGVICGNLRLHARAWTYYREALELNEEKGFRTNQGFLLCNMGLLCQQVGLYDQAEESFRLSMDIHRQSGIRYGYADSLANLGMLLYKHYKRYGEALPMLKEAAQLQLLNNERSKAGLVLANAAVTAFKSGGKEEAMEFFQRAEELVFDSQVWNNQIEFCGMKAEVLIELGDYSSAEELADKAAEILACNLPGEEADESLLLIQSQIYSHRGDWENAYLTLLKRAEVIEELERVKFAAFQSVVKIIHHSKSETSDL